MDCWIWYNIRHCRGITYCIHVLSVLILQWSNSLFQSPVTDCQNANSMVVVDLEAEDADEGINSELVYFFVGNSQDSGPFHIDRENGTLYLIGELDHEITTGYSVRFRRSIQVLSATELLAMISYYTESLHHIDIVYLWYTESLHHIDIVYLWYTESLHHIDIVYLWYTESLHHIDIVYL